MAELWKKHRVLLIAFSVTLLITMFFVGHLGFFILRGALHRNEPIAPWMTVGYIARNVGIDPKELGLEAGMPPRQPRHPLTLQEIAAERGVPVDTVTADLEAAIGRVKARHDKGAKP